MIKNNNMSQMPIELWQIIMEMSNPKTQFIIKQLYKDLYINLIYTDDYITAVQLEVVQHFFTNKLTFGDVIRHLIKKNNCSGTKVIEMFNEIKNNKKY